MWDSGSNPLVPVMPPQWRRVPGTELRLYNYRFGKGSQEGEIYISKARGGVLPNANRWLGQFGQAPLTSTDGLPTVKVLDSQGVLLEATGKFGGGMGKAPIENAGLIGVIADLGSEGLLVVKMIGPAEAVQKEKQRVIDFCQSIRINPSALEGN